MAPPWLAGTQLKFLAVYPLPWDLETSAIVQNSPGIPMTASYVISNAQIRDLIGRNLAACPATQATCTQTVRTELIPPNTMFRAAPHPGGPAGVARVQADGDFTAAGQPRCLQHLQREQRAQHDADLRAVMAECRTGVESTVVESRGTARLLDEIHFELRTSKFDIQGGGT